MVRPYEPLYTVKEVAKILKTNPDYVYELIRKGKLPRLILGSTKIRGSDLEQFIEKQMPEPCGNVGDDRTVSAAGKEM